MDWLVSRSKGQRSKLRPDHSQNVFFGILKVMRSKVKVTDNLSSESMLVDGLMSSMTLVSVKCHTVIYGKVNVCYHSGQRNDTNVW